MKKAFYMAMAAGLALLAVSCGEKPEPQPEHPAVVQAAYTALTNGAVTGDAIKTIPVTATSEAGDLTLTFYSDKVYLPAATFTVGNEIGNYGGHFRNDWLDGDVVAGLITVSLEGEEDYTISGTVRLNDKDGTAVRIRAKGTMFYEFPTENYYTAEAGTGGSTVYRIYDMASSVQMAQVTVFGDADGTYPIAGSGEAGTAMHGSINDGTWATVANYGTHILLHGSVTVKTSHGKKNFTFTDTRSAEFSNCELKGSFTPVVAEGSGISFMRLAFFSEPSPVVKDMYEFTAKMFYDNGQELFSLTAITPTPNPIMELIEKDGKTGGYAFQTKVSYDEYLQLPTSTNRCSIAPASYFVVNGIRYPVPDGFAFVINAQLAGGMVAGLLAPTNMAYALPPELQAYLDGVGGSIWVLIGYVY